jgi:hypothetical protein
LASHEKARRYNLFKLGSATIELISEPQAIQYTFACYFSNTFPFSFCAHTRPYTKHIFNLTKNHGTLRYRAD